MSSLPSNQRLIVILVLVAVISRSSLGQIPCPVEEDPVQLAECAQLDIQAIIQAAKGNLKLFCNLAERYIECFKTKTRNCIGGSVSRLLRVDELVFYDSSVGCRWRFHRVAKSRSMVLRQSGR